jgi:hypothetical protein
MKCLAVKKFPNKYQVEVRRSADQASGVKRSFKESRSFSTTSLMIALRSSSGILAMISSSSIFLSKSIMWEAFSNQMNLD